MNPANLTNVGDYFLSVIEIVSSFLIYMDHFAHDVMSDLCIPMYNGSILATYWIFLSRRVSNKQ